MNKTIKKDALEILKLFKKTNKESIKFACATDYFYLENLIDSFFPNTEWFKIPDEIVKTYEDNIGIFKKTEINIRKQIYNNLDLLEKMYEQIIDMFEKAKVEEINDNIDYKLSMDEIDAEVFENFFNKYEGLNELFIKIYNEKRLLLVDSYGPSYTYNLKSINKDYIVVSSADPIHVLVSLSHEMGHVYQSKIYKDKNLDIYFFLVEFMSILMEHLFCDYYQEVDPKISYIMTINKLAVWSKIFKVSLAQIKLFKKHENAFDNLKLYTKYNNELDSLCTTDFNFKKDDLYLNFYPIGFMIAINFFYQLKYGLDFNEVQKFYILNNEKNNLNDLLTNYVDLDAIKEYLREYTIIDRPKIFKKNM